MTFPAQSFAFGNTSPIPSGTVLLFYQASAPVGWTQVTTQNNKALRIVSGTGGGTGGSVAFTTAFAANTVGSTTITTATMPSHTHTATTLTSSGFPAYPATACSGERQTSTNTGSTGSDGSHTHSFQSLAVQYIDIIICSKN